MRGSRGGEEGDADRGSLVQQKSPTNADKKDMSFFFFLFFLSSTDYPTFCLDVIS